MPQRVFDILRGGVAGLGKGTEGGHIGEVSVVVPPHVQRHGSALGDDVGGHVGHGGNVQRGGEVVGAAGGQIAQQGLFRQLHQAGNGFVQRAVAAVADHGVVVGTQLQRIARGVAGGLGLLHVHQIPALAQPHDGVIQRRGGFVFSRAGIHDQKQLFHRIPPQTTQKNATERFFYHTCFLSKKQ